MMQPEPSFAPPEPPVDWTGHEACREPWNEAMARLVDHELRLGRSVRVALPGRLGEGHELVKAMVMAGLLVLEGLEGQRWALASPEGLVIVTQDRTR